MNRENPRNEDDRAQEHDQGIRERSVWCSSRRVLVQLTESAGWWMGDDDSHGVEISIARCVRKMVREEDGSCPNSSSAKATSYTGSFPQPQPCVTHTSHHTTHDS